MLLVALLAVHLDDLLADLGDNDVPDISTLRAQSFDVGSDRRTHHRRA
jgi:hypothetical protein